MTFNWILRSLSWKHLPKSDGFFQHLLCHGDVVSSTLRFALMFLQTQWHDLEINTYGTLVGWLEPHVWKIWVKMGFLPSRGETSNFWNHHQKLHCNTGLLVDLLNICGRSCLKISNLCAGLQSKKQSYVACHFTSKTRTCLNLWCPRKWVNGLWKGYNPNVSHL